MRVKTQETTGSGAGREGIKKTGVGGMQGEGRLFRVSCELDVGV